MLLNELDESTRVATGLERRELRVLATPGFAARWLLPRLDRFPGWHRLRLRISDSAPSTDFATNDADVVIHWSDKAVPGVAVEPLMESGRYPVASPGLIAREAIEEPSDLLRVTLFRDEVFDGWENWFRTAGLGSPRLSHGPRFPNCELITTAAECGQGVALAYDAIVRGALVNGTLVRLFDTVSLPITIYSFACQESRHDDPSIHAFRDWLFAEVAVDGTLAHRAAVAAE